MKIHDVTLVLRPDMPVWPNEKGPEITPLRRLAKGDGANVSVVSFANHTGTHVDPPVHFIDGATTVDRLPLDALVGPCAVVAYEGTEHIGASWLGGAGIDGSGADWLVARGVKCVGVDYLSVEPFGSGPAGHPVHKTLLRAGVVIIEGLDLSAVRPGRYDLVCGAIKLENGDGAPARVFLLER